MTKESDQQTAIYIKHKAQGLEDSDIKRIILGYKQEGILGEKSEEAVKSIDDAFNKHMKAISDKAIEDKKVRKERIKDYRKILGDGLKQFELNDSYKKRVLDLATKEDKDGRFEIDRLYAEARKNPKDMADLVLFLADKEEYIEQIVKEQKEKGKLESYKTIYRIKKEGSVKLPDVDDEDTDVVDIKNLT